MPKLIGPTLPCHQFRKVYQRSEYTWVLHRAQISNGPKIARMAPISTIFGLFRSQRCQLQFPKFARRRKRIREGENVENLCEKIRAA